MSLTNEEKLLGVTENDKQKKEEVLSIKTLFKIKNVDMDNESIVNGAFIKRILPLSEQNKLLYGQKELRYNGFDIKVFENKQTKTKPDFESMNFNKLKAYCLENNIDIKGLKSKEAIIEKLKEV